MYKLYITFSDIQRYIFFDVYNFILFNRIFVKCKKKFKRNVIIYNRIKLLILLYKVKSTKILYIYINSVDKVTSLTFSNIYIYFKCLIVN